MFILPAFCNGSFSTMCLFCIPLSTSEPATVNLNNKNTFLTKETSFSSNRPPIVIQKDPKFKDNILIEDIFMYLLVHFSKRKLLEMFVDHLQLYQNSIAKLHVIIFLLCFFNLLNYESVSFEVT